MNSFTLNISFFKNFYENRKTILVKNNIFRSIKRYLFIFIIKLMKNKLNEEEASINQSLYYPKNLIFELKKIYPEKMNYINNNYFNKIK